MPIIFKTQRCFMWDLFKIVLDVVIYSVTANVLNWFENRWSFFISTTANSPSILLGLIWWIDLLFWVCYTVHQIFPITFWIYWLYLFIKVIISRLIFDCLRWMFELNTIIIDVLILIKLVRCLLMYLTLTIYKLSIFFMIPIKISKIMVVMVIFTFLAIYTVHIREN